MTSTPAHPDAISVALLQLAQHAERLAVLDAREAGHHLQLAEHLAGLATQVSELASAVDGTGDMLERLSARILPDHDAGTGPAGYRPGPAPRASHALLPLWRRRSTVAAPLHRHDRTRGPCHRRMYRHAIDAGR